MLHRLTHVWRGWMGRKTGAEGPTVAGNGQVETRTGPDSARPYFRFQGRT